MDDAASPEDGDDALPPDGFNPGPCWPIDTTAPGGQAEVGTGEQSYLVMPDELPLVYGDQMGYHITARARMRGMNPGELGKVLSPLNPRTKFKAISLEDGTVMGDFPCPQARVFYVPADDGDGNVMPAYTEIRFDTSLMLSQIVDKQYKVIVEIIDADGKYARAEKIITARAPQ
jgi:hypothetical protein